MKKTLLLLTFIFVCMSTYTQNATSSLEKLGNFRIGMTQKELKDAIKKHKLKNTKVDTYEEFGFLYVYNIKLNGLTYDRCIFRGIDELNTAIFMKKCRTMAGAEREKVRLIKSLENEYGEPASSSGKSTIWRDEQKRSLLVNIVEDDEGISLSLAYMGI